MDNHLFDHPKVRERIGSSDDRNKLYWQAYNKAIAKDDGLAVRLIETLSEQEMGLNSGMLESFATYTASWNTFSTELGTINNYRTELE